jgi:hypothetical protein
MMDLRALPISCGYPSICRDDSLTRIADKFVRAQRTLQTSRILFPSFTAAKRNPRWLLSNIRHGESYSEHVASQAQFHTVC